MTVAQALSSAIKSVAQLYRRHRRYLKEGGSVSMDPGLLLSQLLPCSLASTIRYTRAMIALPVIHNVLHLFPFPWPGTYFHHSVRIVSTALSPSYLRSSPLPDAAHNILSSYPEQHSISPPFAFVALVSLVAYPLRAPLTLPANRSLLSSPLDTVDVSKV